MPWNPTPQPRWLDALNALGDNLGDAGAAMVSLDEASLLESAAANTGLDDFGGDWFREPLHILLTALENEANLTLTGRVLARAEIQRILQNRLRLEDTWKRHPEILQQPIDAPIVVTGLGRSGTTLLHELLAEDPANRVPRQWETMYSVPPQAGQSESDSRIAGVEREIVMMDECDPAFPAMHELGARLPAECIYIFAHQFATDKFTGEYFTPSYALWHADCDRTPVYNYHRRVLQLLQWRHPGERWVLKAPSHISRLHTLFATYPDARVVVTHRDPLRVIGSLANLMATLQRMRSDHVHYELQIEGMAESFAANMEKMADARRGGELPDGRITDVLYRDLVADPIATVEQLYGHWGINLADAARQRMQAYLDRRGHGKGRATHQYRFADTGLNRDRMRERYARYMNTYDVPEEV